MGKRWIASSATDIGQFVSSRRVMDNFVRDGFKEWSLILARDRLLYSYVQANNEQFGCLSCEQRIGASFVADK